MFLDFSTKMQSPTFIIPEDRHYNKQELINTIQDIKANLLKAIETLDTTKTCTAFEVPASGYITRSEGITFAIVHTQRHVHQLKNIRMNIVNL